MPWDHDCSVDNSSSRAQLIFAISSQSQSSYRSTNSFQYSNLNWELRRMPQDNIAKAAQRLYLTAALIWPWQSQPHYKALIPSLFKPSLMAIPETEAGTGNNCAPPVVFTLIPSRTLTLSNIACSGRRQLTKSLNTEDQDNDGLWLFSTCSYAVRWCPRLRLYRGCPGVNWLPEISPSHFLSVGLQCPLSMFLFS